MHAEGLFDRYITELDDNAFGTREPGASFVLLLMEDAGSIVRVWELYVAAFPGF